MQLHHKESIKFLLYFLFCPHSLFSTSCYIQEQSRIKCMRELDDDKNLLENSLQAEDVTNKKKSGHYKL